MTADYQVATKGPFDMVDVTGLVLDAVAAAGIDEGICLVSCPHTTAAVTVNENADPDVRNDLLKAFAELSPDRPWFRHAEGNSRAHLLSSLVGPSVALPVIGGRLALGTWQAVWFCEFDGPRRRSLKVSVVGA